jgi:hypothetical protein
MDKQEKQQVTDNRAKQLNPNNPESGPGHQAGWHGNTEKASMDKKSNQQNPNHERTNPKK